MFWLQWGADVGSTACKKVLLDREYINANTYTTLDSLNNFVFVIPRTDGSSDSIKATIAGGRKISISKEQFEAYKKQRIWHNDSASIILETYAYADNNDNVLKKYTINNVDVFPINENFMFRVHEYLTCEDYTHITTSILWYLSNTYMLCDNTYSSTFENKLGIYLLHFGYEAGDEYSVLPLAELYAKGIYVSQDTVHAKKILMSLVKEEKAERMIQKWINEDE